MTLLEKLDNRFPELGKKLKSFSREKKTTLWQDMCLCAAVTLACAFYEFELFLPVFATDIIKIMLTALFVICWLRCAFVNGFWKKYSFLVFIAVFWIIPHLIILRYNSIGFSGYNRFRDAAAQYSQLITDFSLVRLANLIGTTYITIVLILISWCFVMFFAGKLFAKSFDNNT